MSPGRLCDVGRNPKAVPFRNVVLSLSKTPSEFESTAQQAKMLRKIVEEEPDVCELDEGTCVCRREIAYLGGADQRHLEFLLNGLWFYNDQRTSPVFPKSNERYPEKSISIFEARSLNTSFQDIQLIPEREVLQGKRTMRPQR